MWLLPIIGLAVGAVIGSAITIQVPAIYIKYMSIAVLASLDSVFGGIRAILEDHFDGAVLLTGFFTNALLAALLAYLGDRLDVDLLWLPFCFRCAPLSQPRHNQALRCWFAIAIKTAGTEVILLRTQRWHIPMTIVFLFVGILLPLQFQAQSQITSDLSMQRTENLIAMVRDLSEKRQNCRWRYRT